jgi:LytTr DNA-binding domain
MAMFVLKCAATPKQQQLLSLLSAGVTLILLTLLIPTKLDAFIADGHSLSMLVQSMTVFALETFVATRLFLYIIFKVGKHKVEITAAKSFGYVALFNIGLYLGRRYIAFLMDDVFYTYEPKGIKALPFSFGLYLITTIWFYLMCFWLCSGHHETEEDNVTIVTTESTEEEAQVMSLQERLVLTSFDAKPKEYRFLPEQIYYIEAESNYLAVWYEEEGTLKSEIVRLTMAALLTQFAEFPFIKRCHKSYVVNTLKVSRISGNSKGYNLVLADKGLKIPVSRQYNQHLEQFVDKNMVVFA